MSDNTLQSMKPESEPSSEQAIQQLEASQHFLLTVGQILDHDTLLAEAAVQVNDLLGCQRTLLLVANQETAALNYGAITSPPADPLQESALKQLAIPIFNAQDNPVIQQWLRGMALELTPGNTSTQPSLGWLLDAVSASALYSQPLVFSDQLLGVLLINNGDSPQHPDQQSQLSLLAPGLALALRNANIYSETVRKSSAGMHELYILRQIDRELNDNIELDHVFNIALDWALRFTNAHAAALTLYDQEHDQLRLMRQYGYDIMNEELDGMRPHRGGITHRVALTGRPEVIPDVSMDKDYIRTASFAKAQLSVPVLREDRVIAVITLESKKINGFTDEHLDFVEKLATRAGVAIDNARLFSETRREREKLSHIINNTADIIIVVGLDDRIILINPSAFQALRLYPGDDYVGHSCLPIPSWSRFTAGRG
jgi:GAF domain-containing protein